MVKSVYVRRAVPSDKLAIVDNLLAANAEAELEVEPVSIVDTVAAVEKVLADPSSNTRQRTAPSKR